MAYTGHGLCLLWDNHELHLTRTVFTVRWDNQRLTFDTDCVYCETATEFLSIVWKNINLRRIESLRLLLKRIIFKRHWFQYHRNFSNAKFRYFFNLQAFLVMFPNPNTEIWTLFANNVIWDAQPDKAVAFSYRQLTLYGRNVFCFI